MTTSAIVMMVIGCVIIWGGLTVSILHAVRASKKDK
ncbi:methionine/alanine import family NSS transporter small subunit [Amphibacillus marinus]|nr:methionine/alanine import family NSS transporter small subunit [Amphibacillus marinus]